MTQYVAFLRAINVAGHARITMEDLGRAFTAAGCRNIRTFIQSGNVIFASPVTEPAAIAKKIGRELRKILGEEPGILLRPVAAVQSLVRSGVFNHVEAGANVKLYVVFLSAAPRITPQFPLISAKEAVEIIGMNGLDVFVVSHPKKKGFFDSPTPLSKRSSVFPPPVVTGRPSPSSPNSLNRQSLRREPARPSARPDFRGHNPIRDLSPTPTANCRFPRRPGLTRTVT